VKEQDDLDKKAAGVAEESDAKYVLIMHASMPNIPRGCFQYFDTVGWVSGRASSL